MTLDTAYGGPQQTAGAGVEIQRGNIPGHDIFQPRGRNPAVGIFFEDVWDAGGVLTYPTVGEQWEIFSSSSNDTAAGTGMRTVLMAFLDDNFVRQTEIITLNGTTAVSTVATNILRPIGSQGLTWGSTEENEGEIIVQVAGGSGPTARRGGILFDTSVVGDERGFNASQDGRYTTPAGKTSFITGIINNVQKNFDVTLRLFTRQFGQTAFILLAEMNNYQTSFQDQLEEAPIPLPEKTDVKIQVRSDNTSVSVSTFMLITEVDN